MPTKTLQSLVEAYGTEKWGANLEEVIKTAYASLLVSIPLESATAAQFDSCFKNTFPVQDNVLKKCKPFFLNAAKEADIKISPYIINGKRPSGGGARRQISKKKNALKETVCLNSPPADLPEKTPAASPPPSEMPSARPSQVLLKLLTKDMPEEQRQAIWALIQYYIGKDDAWPK